MALFDRHKYTNAHKPQDKPRPWGCVHVWTQNYKCAVCRVYASTVEDRSSHGR
jgi:hypothetical protein